ncbi:hypothetical protein LCGC14_2415550 [marine sediment metagenome]|uniref:TNase-like domain-containing protein n=1 Tax=marine sediment metagenome TaxID=412755 RepID=A0A0F9CDE5_9ZZZZ
MAFTVTGIIDGDTFETDGDWTLNKETGHHVRIIGIDTPERGQPGYDAATQKLSDLVLGKSVELKGAVKVDRGRLVCKVYLDGTDIVDLL